MAEIKIEKKKPVWPWILIAVIILAVIGYFVFADEQTDDYMEENNTQGIGAENNIMDFDAENRIGHVTEAVYQDSAKAMSLI
jgi:hypothetical protein